MMMVVKITALSSSAKVLGGFSSLTRTLLRWMAVTINVISLQSWPEWADWLTAHDTAQRVPHSIVLVAFCKVLMFELSEPSVYTQPFIKVLNSQQSLMEKHLIWQHQQSFSFSASTALGSVSFDSSLQWLICLDKVMDDCLVGDRSLSLAVY